MAAGRLIRLPREGAVRLVLCILLLVSLYLLSAATQDTEVFGRLHPWLLFFNSICLAGLLALIAWNLTRLVLQRRRDQPGSRITVRLVSMFVVLALVPVSVVYYFSVQFLHQGIDSWFDTRMEQRILEDALNLSQASFDVRMRELLRRTERAAVNVHGMSDAIAPIRLGEMREQLGATELTLMASSGRIIATSAQEPSAMLPHRPEEDILFQLRQGRPYVGLDPVGDAGLQIRVLVPAPGSDGMPDQRLLQGLFPVSPRVNALADEVQQAYARHQEVGYLARPLQESFTLTLSLVLLLSVLFAVWSAFFAARKLVEPIRHLAEGTRAVAAGEYGTQLPPAGRDELGFLVRSFNDMSRRVAQARDDASSSQAQVENQRAYLETVLGRLSSGVVALDRGGRLRTWNRAADQILGLSLKPFTGESLAALGQEQAGLLAFAELVQRRLDENVAEWREQVTVTVPGGRLVLMCSGASLPGAMGTGGYVIVFDDVTALIQAQRDAAWAEVARRLAHEIKNPLTPIQLSAERMRHKCLKVLEGRERDLLDRGTHTIIEQVEAMKTMVNAFSEYAHPPHPQQVSVDLNALVRQVAELYRSGDMQITLQLADDLPELRGDPGRLRQLLHNLLKNALEASAGRDGRLELVTSAVDDERFRGVQLQVRDFGPGFSDEVLTRLFEPYVTTKSRGTGLGMPIVKKIVEEHNGQIGAENLADGALVTMRFPLPVNAPSASIGPPQGARLGGEGT